MPGEKIVGYKVMFRMGKFRMNIYMKQDYYEIWKHFRDERIRDVYVEEVELEASRFFDRE
ncbi:hypothetical protein [Paenibacillus sacheonensis]|uniref:Uncharacterized protein n=1 Tax=Paenibacillus sacheonensis TaxID=742054 RepID=A0A7X4YVX9_9BACL|nr:hypothetical protein [Paenibacillus sacheonensis]MBM7564315.1 hypothetical protein [Paenibacillus sacheonensis]NBC73453.1 hypothetical protein [Paenibacillus sacheonensis]